MSKPDTKELAPTLPSVDPADADSVEPDTVADSDDSDLSNTSEVALRISLLGKLVIPPSTKEED